MDFFLLLKLRMMCRLRLVKQLVARKIEGRDATAVGGRQLVGLNPTTGHIFEVFRHLKTFIRAGFLSMQFDIFYDVDLVFLKTVQFFT